MTRRRSATAGVAGFGALVLSTLLLLASPVLAFASQEPSETAASTIEPLYVRRIDGTDATHVKVSFIWNGDRGALQDLTVRENGAQVAVSQPEPLARAGVPISVALVIDQSGSMRDSGAIDETKAAMTRLIDDLAPADTIAVVGFSDEVTTFLQPSTDRAAAREAIDQVDGVGQGKTALWDAVARASALVEEDPAAQPNLFIVTDGTDDVSKASSGLAAGRVVGAGAAVWVMGIDTEGELDRAHLDDLVGRSGGQLFDTGSAAQVGEAFDQVAFSLRNQYVVEYSSPAGRGSNDVDVAVGDTVRSAFYVTGASSEGASARPVEEAEPWGPDFLRSSIGQWASVLAAGLAAGLGVYAVAQLISKEPSALDQALSAYSRDGYTPEADGGSGNLAQTALLQRAVQVTEEFAEKRGVLTKVEALLERADLPLRAAEALFFYLVAVGVVGLLAMLVYGPVKGLLVLALAAAIPYVLLLQLAGKRRKKFGALLPDMLQLLSGSLRAGYSLMQGVEAVSQEVAEPMGKELRRIMTEARLGRDLEEAMEGTAERMDSDDFAWAVMAVRIQREVGGNLAELLMTVSETMISRERLRRDVSTLTAEGKISAIVIGGLPIGLGGVMYAINPEYMTPLFTDGFGQVMLGLAIVAALIGFVWMKKTITIKI